MQRTLGFGSIDSSSYSVDLGGASVIESQLVAVQHLSDLVSNGRCCGHRQLDHSAIERLRQASDPVGCPAQSSAEMQGPVGQNAGRMDRRSKAYFQHGYLHCNTKRSHLVLTTRIGSKTAESVDYDIRHMGCFEPGQDSVLAGQMAHKP
jgi:hypothetical protein